MATELDIAVYVTVPGVNVPQAVALGIALLSALPAAAQGPATTLPAMKAKATATAWRGDRAASGLG